MNMRIETPLQTDSTRTAQLAEAFRLFSEASEGLSASYASLQEQVARLTFELAQANGKLHREYQEKALLTERLGLLLDALPAGVLVLDDQARISQCNPAAEALLGTALENESWSEISTRRLRPASTEGAAGTVGEWLCDPMGQFVGGAHDPLIQRRLVLTQVALPSSNGHLLLVHDVTESHLMKTTTARNERLAAMGEMAASLAHQLRTPLSAAVLYAGAIESGTLGAAEQTRCAAKISDRLRNLDRLISDMLGFARGETSGGETLTVAELLDETAQTAESLAQAREMLFSVEDASEGASITGTRKVLTGALLNLIENAFQACAPGGRVSLRATCDGSVVRFAVQDEGAGMDARTLERIFEPFFTTRAEGTGLGLAIVRGVARAHGGGVEAFSTPGSGARFVLSLPHISQSKEKREHAEHSITHLNTQVRSQNNFDSSAKTSRVKPSHAGVCHV